MLHRGQNEQVSEERDSEYEALDERLQAIYSRYFLPLVNAYKTGKRRLLKIHFPASFQAMVIVEIIYQQGVIYR